MVKFWYFLVKWWAKFTKKYQNGMVGPGLVLAGLGHILAPLGDTSRTILSQDRAGQEQTWTETGTDKDQSQASPDQGRTLLSQDRPGQDHTWTETGTDRDLSQASPDQDRTLLSQDRAGQDHTWTQMEKCG